MKAKTKLRRYARIRKKLESVFAAVDNVVAVVDAAEYAKANKAVLVLDFDLAVKEWRNGIEGELIKNVLIHGQIRRMHLDMRFITIWDIEARKKEVVRFIYEVLYTTRTRRFV